MVGEDVFIFFLYFYLAKHNYLQILKEHVRRLFIFYMYEEQVKKDSVGSA